MQELIDVIESYNEYIKKIPSGCQIIADKLRADEIAEAMSGISDFSEGANWLLNVCAALNKHDIAVNLPTEKLNGFLIEVNDGLEIQDYVVVADMFEYEIQPFFEEYSDEVKLKQ